MSTSAAAAFFTYGVYTVVLSHTEKNIYIKLTDTVNFMCYETTYDERDFSKHFSLSEHGVILRKCFEQTDEAFLITLIPETNNLKLQVRALVGGIIRVDFTLFVAEKILSNDGQLTLTFNRLEQKQEHEVKALTQKYDSLLRRCETLETALVNQREEFFKVIDRLDVLLFSPASISNQTQFPWAAPKISSENLEINCASLGDANSLFRLHNLSIFYKLKKLKLNGYAFRQNLQEWSTETLVEMELNCSANGTFKSLDGIANFPSLTTLTVFAAPALANVVQTLKSAPHKIKTIKFQGCSAVNVVELQTYCQENKIFLALS